MAKKSKKDEQEAESIDFKDVLAIYDELDELKEENPEAVAAVNKKYAKKGIIDRLLEFYIRMYDRFHIEVPVKKRTYCWLCLLGPIGVHHFYAKHWIKGLLYLAISWTAIPVALSVIDWMEAYPKKPDENGMIIV